MWHIVRAEWGNNWRTLPGLIVMTHVMVTGNILFLNDLLFDALAGAAGRESSGATSPNLSLLVLAVASLLPATLGPSALFLSEGSERRLQMWAALPLSRTQLGLAYGTVLLTPWPLAVASYAGLSLWCQGLTASPFSCGGLVLAFLAVTWLMAMVFGRKVAHIGMFALYMAIGFLAEPAVLVLSTVFGWGLADAEGYQFGTMWHWLQLPYTGILPYLLAAAMLLVSLLLFRRRELR
ncbi:MAG: hypothetical protein O2782_21880 [bacterium]|nr:hypothetical protein [bacterium]